MAPTPYPGLRPFGTEEAHLFFGRDQSIHDITEKLKAARFVAVVGPSGCGKSSILRAGVLPALLSNPQVAGERPPKPVVMRPGAAPMRNLRCALAEYLGTGPADNSPEAVDPGDSPDDWEHPLLESIRNQAESGKSACLLVVDQFEEIFRYRAHSSGHDARRFVDLLLKLPHWGPVSVLMTMRADYVGACVEFTGLAEALNTGQYLLPRLGQEQIRRAIECPAAWAGSAVEPELVARIIDDMGSESDQLGLMQHALRMTWARAADSGHAGQALSVQTYYEVGGIPGSLHMQAEEIMAELDSDKQQLTRWIFRLLTEKEPSGYQIRRPATVQQIASVSGAELATVLEVAHAFPVKAGIC